MQKHSATFPQSPIPRFPSTSKKNPEQDPSLPAPMPQGTTASQPDAPDDRRLEGREVPPPEQPLSFPPAGMQAPQTPLSLPLLACPSRTTGRR